MKSLLQRLQSIEVDETLECEAERKEFERRICILQHEAKQDQTMMATRRRMARAHIAARRMKQLQEEEKKSLYDHVKT